MTVSCWDQLTREELAAVAADAVLVFPIGATEQHGPHLVTSVDRTIVEALARRGAEYAQKPAVVLLAPPLPFGSSDHHLPFGGTLSLSADTLRAVLRDLLRSAAASGVRRVLLLNGHGGNTATCTQVAADAATQHGIIVGAANYWDLASAASVWAISPGHAGAMETSLMLALRPDGVRGSRMRECPGKLPASPHGLRLEVPGMWQAIDGFTDDPQPADADAGNEVLARYAQGVAAAIDALADAARLTPPLDRDAPSPRH